MNTNEPEENQKTGFARVLSPFTETFGLSRSMAIVAVVLIAAIIGGAVFWFFHSSPPKELIITSGPPGSSFETNAQKYATILARNGVKLKILPSEGSLQNLERLSNPAFKVEVGFVQGGTTNSTGANGVQLVSLGSISYEPLVIFYRGEPVTLLSEFKGKRLGIGPAGAGSHTLGLTLLHLNGIDHGGATTLLEEGPDDAARDLLAGNVDAVFLMGDSASPQLIRQLLIAPEIHLLDFAQADAYSRKFTYLNKLVMPRGAIDFGKDIPSRDINMISPTVELIARPDLHPALSDLLLEAAREVHGGGSIFKHKGEFPVPIEQDFPISSDAARFYKSGKKFLYGSMPFWLATLLRQIFVAFVPAVVVLIPILKFIPATYKWRVRMRIFRWYRALLALEREIDDGVLPEKRADYLKRLDQIEQAVNKMKVPASFADQFYGLRGDIAFVRDQINKGASGAAC